MDGALKNYRDTSHSHTQRKKGPSKLEKKHKKHFLYLSKKSRKCRTFGLRTRLMTFRNLPTSANSRISKIRRFKSGSQMKSLIIGQTGEFWEFSLFPLSMEQPTTTQRIFFFLFWHCSCFPKWHCVFSVRLELCSSVCGPISSLEVTPYGKEPRSLAFAAAVEINTFDNRKKTPLLPGATKKGPSAGIITHPFIRSLPRSNIKPLPVYIQKHFFPLSALPLPISPSLL